MTPLVLTSEIKDLVNNALETGHPLLLAAVTADKKPTLSFRGSTQVYSDSALGLWVRNPSGNTIEAIRINPNVALMYRSATTPMLQFRGRARIVADPAERARVYESAPERERNADPERKGIAIIIDLDAVEGVLKLGPKGPEFVKLTA